MHHEYKTVPLELKGATTEKGQFDGHGAVFGNVDLQGDIILPGAFSKSLKTHKERGTMPQMYWMHQPDQVPGRWLSVGEDEKGLPVIGELLPTSLGKDMAILMKAQAVRGLSIGYQTLKADYDRDGNRLLKELDLWEVSLVSLAANPLAEVESVKARLSRNGEWVPRPRDFERFLRESGYSKTVATKITAKVFGGTDPTSAAPREAEDEDLKHIGRLLNARLGMDRPVESLFE